MREAGCDADEGHEWGGEVGQCVLVGGVEGCWETRWLRVGVVENGSEGRDRGEMVSRRW